MSIAELAEMISDVVGYAGRIEYNSDYPDGTKQKLLVVYALSAHGWKARIGLKEGIAATYDWYLDVGGSSSAGPVSGVGLSEAGHDVLCMDIDADRIAALRDGRNIWSQSAVLRHGFTYHAIGRPSARA